MACTSVMPPILTVIGDIPARPSRGQSTKAIFGGVRPIQCRRYPFASMRVPFHMIGCWCKHGGIQYTQDPGGFAMGGIWNHRTFPVAVMAIVTAIGLLAKPP